MKIQCISKNSCPLNGNCFLENIIYIATIMCGKNNSKSSYYKEITENAFKKRYQNHKRLFNINKYKNDIKLSIKYWNLKVWNTNPKAACEVKKKQLSACNPQSKKCSFCLNERLEILEGKKSNLPKKKWSTKMTSSKHTYLTNSCARDPIPLRHMKIKIPLHRNF